LSKRAEEEFVELVEVIARLRGENGCPWDKQQTHETLREFLLEECYEVLEALDERDPQKLSQELGDLLLQIMLHAQIAAENGEFQLEDVINNIKSKIIRRHPHVFGDVRVKNADEVSYNWESIKKEERKPGASLLDSVPVNMPALAYSQEVQRRAAQVGFDWEDIEGVIEKLAEEIREFQRSTTLTGKEDEFGDIVFTLVNIARKSGIDAETALRQANRKFYQRFKAMESLCKERNLSLDKLTFAEQNALWEEAKRIVEASNRCDEHR